MLSFTPPAWVEKLFVVMTLTGQMSDAGTKNCVMAIDSAAGTSGGQFTVTSGTTNMGLVKIHGEFTSFPAVIDGDVSVSTGTNATNSFILTCEAFGTRL